MSMHPAAHTPSALLDLFVRFVHEAQLDAALSLYEVTAAMVEKPGRIARGEAVIDNPYGAAMGGSS